MKLPEPVICACSFLRLHRLVVLISTIVILASILCVHSLWPRPIAAVEPGVAPPVNISIHVDPGLPPRPLKPWGPDPFRNILKEMEIARRKQLDEEQKAKEEQAKKLAAEEAGRKQEEDAARKAQEEAQEAARRLLLRREEEIKERNHRRAVIRSLRIDGILFNPKGDSAIIIEGKPCKTGDTITKNGVETRVEEIESDRVILKDTLTGESHKVFLVK